jgi:hypothetical protein
VTTLHDGAGIRLGESGVNLVEEGSLVSPASMLAMGQFQRGQSPLAIAAEAFFRQPIRIKIHAHLRQSAEGLRIF